MFRSTLTILRPICESCFYKHVAPPNLNKLDVLDVKCLSFNIEPQHIGMSSIKYLPLVVHRCYRLRIVLLPCSCVRHLPGVYCCNRWIVAAAEIS